VRVNSTIVQVPNLLMSKGERRLDNGGREERNLKRYRSDRREGRLFKWGEDRELSVSVQISISTSARWQKRRIPSCRETRGSGKSMGLVIKEGNLDALAILRTS